MNIRIKCSKSLAIKLGAFKIGGGALLSSYAKSRGFDWPTIFLIDGDDVYLWPVDKEIVRESGRAE